MGSGVCVEEGQWYWGCRDRKRWREKSWKGDLGRQEGSKARKRGRNKVCSSNSEHCPQLLVVG